MSKKYVAGCVNKIGIFYPIVRVTFGDVVDLPEERPDTFLIVSAMVRSALPNRKDLASPGDLIRNDQGVVIGCKNLIIN